MVMFYLLYLGLGAFLIEKEGQSTRLDEFFVLAIAPVALFGIKPLYKQQRYVLICICIYFSFLVASSVVTLMIDEYGTVPILAPVIGTVLDTKLWIMLLAFTTVSRSLVNNPDQAIIVMCKVILLVCAFHAVFFIDDIFRGYSLSGVPLRLSKIWGYVPIGLFSHKSDAALINGLGIVASLTLLIHRKHVIYFAPLIFFLGLLVFSSSLKELLAVGAMVALLAIPYRSIWSSEKDLPKRVLILFGIALGVMSGLLAIWDIVFSLINTKLLALSEDTVRVKMYEASIKIAVDQFPFGSGAGTFGSQPSRSLYYSPFYYEYGLYRLYGGSINFSGYLMDTWWPKVYGEAGFFGGMAYLLAITLPMYGLVKSFIAKASPTNTFGVLLGVLMLFTSMASAVFTDKIGFMLTALFILMHGLSKDGTVAAKIRYSLIFNKYVYK